MKYLMVIILAFSLVACNSSGESQEGNEMTATINGEEWQFFETSVTRTAEGMEITGLGYLEGDQGAIPVELNIKVVDIPATGDITTPFTAYFAPNTQENAALATIKPENQPETYETELDSNAGGTIVFTEATGGQLNGEFNFIATDKDGRKLEVENGRFNGLSY